MYGIPAQSQPASYLFQHFKPAQMLQVEEFESLSRQFFFSSTCYLPSLEFVTEC